MEQNKFKRLWQHLLNPVSRVAQFFPLADLQHLANEIAASENTHLGQIRFVVESRYPITAILSGLDNRTRARQWFGELGVWDTEHNSGVLIYVCFADRAVEIIADRGIAAKVDNAIWQTVCDTMRQAFRQHCYMDGLRAGLRQADECLRAYFPFDGQSDDKPNELADDVVLR